MKDEIKEILNKWKCYIEHTKKFTTNEYEMLRVEDIDKILDYITNLQDRTKELETINEEHRKLNGSLREANNNLYKIEEFMYNQAIEYNIRIDKAIEYIQNKTKNEFTFDNDRLIDLFNILQGKSDE